MRVNVYAEEMTGRVELITKEVEGQQFTAVRFYLELPATGPDGTQHQGPFMHRPGDDDSSAVTFWGKRGLAPMLRKALQLLESVEDEPTPSVDLAKVGDELLQIAAFGVGNGDVAEIMARRTREAALQILGPNYGGD